MAYEKTNWVDNETPINAANLNKMEDGIVEASKTGGVLEGTVVGWNGDVIPEGYEEVKKGYSTEETLTGKTWIDGKPIYTKTFITEKLGDISISINNFKDMINISGCINTTIGISRPLNTFYQGENGFDAYFSSSVYAVSATVMTIVAGEFLINNFKNAIITVEYTKTTD